AGVGPADLPQDRADCIARAVPGRDQELVQPCCEPARRAQPEVSEVRVEVSIDSAGGFTLDRDGMSTLRPPEGDEPETVLPRERRSDRPGPLQLQRLERR